MEGFSRFIMERIPDASIVIKTYPGGEETWRAPNFGEQGGTSITITAPVAIAGEGVNTAALRRAGAEPHFAGEVSVQVLLPNDASRVSGMRQGEKFFAFSWAQWRALDHVGAADITEKIERRRAAALAYNARVEAEARGHPANMAAKTQTAREAQILAEFPTAEVDAWIIEHMGYTGDEVASWGRSTRRDRRRAARQQMRMTMEQ